MIKISIKPFGKKWNPQNEVTIFFLFQNLELPKVEADLKEVKEALNLAKEEGFQGDLYSSVTLPLPNKSSLGKKVIFMGLGKREGARSLTFREAVGRMITSLRGKNSGLWMVLPSGEPYGETSSRMAQMATEGILLGSYRFEKYMDPEALKKWHAKLPKKVILYGPGGDTKGYQEGIERGKIFSEATIFVRDLVNEGASVVTPAYLADVAKKISSQAQNINVTIFDEKKLQRMNFGGIYGVGRGSKNPPRFIRLTYTPPRRVKKRIALVGKGVTFDTGGVNIKPTSGIETMKEDMSGAGAVLGIFSALTKLKPDLQIVGLIPAAENMVDGNSYKPGDILTTYSGKTIEVINTDAEGRLLLADALGYCVKKEKVDEIIDMATLTGASILALGKKYTAAFFTDSKLQDMILEAGKKAGERIWPLPLELDYMKDLKSEFASIKNAPVSRFGGTIHGALFLYHFLEGKKIPWAHLDIAPSAWSREYVGHITYGGTGTMVRTLLEYFLSIKK